MDQHDQNQAQDGQKYHAELTAAILRLVLLNQAEIRVLRQKLQDADIVIDEQEFKSQRQMFFAGVLEDFRKTHPQFADAIPSTEAFIERGIWNYSR